MWKIQIYVYKDIFVNIRLKMRRDFRYIVECAESADIYERYIYVQLLCAASYILCADCGLSKVWRECRDIYVIYIHCAVIYDKVCILWTEGMQIYMGPDWCKWGRDYASGLMAPCLHPALLHRRLKPKESVIFCSREICLQPFW